MAERRIPPDRSRYVVAAGAGAAIVVALIAIVLLRSSAASATGVRHDAAIRSSARELRVALGDAEAAHRGMLLTGEAALLTPYGAALATLDRELERLDEMVGAGSALQPRVDAVRSSLASEVASMTDAIHLARAGDRDGAVRLVAASGRRAARDQLDQVIADQDAAITRLGVQQGYRLWIGTVVIAGGSALAFVSVVLGLRVARHHRVARDEAYDRLAAQADELGRQGADLERRNRDLDQFAYVASHDLKAPLRGIASLVTWIEEDLGERVAPETREHLRLLRSRVNRLEALVEGVLAYARADRLRGEVAEVDTRKLIDEVLDLAPAPTGVSVEVVGAWPTLDTHRAPLQQVWINLLSNAYRHAARAGHTLRVEVGAAPNGDGCRFWIDDDGPGIDPRFHDRVFQMFQTLQPRDQKESTGIGLAIVRRLVEAHGGKVWVESRDDRGVRFCFTWSQA